MKNKIKLKPSEVNRYIIQRVLSGDSKTRRRQLRRLKNSFPEAEIRTWALKGCKVKTQVSIKLPDINSCDALQVIDGVIPVEAGIADCGCHYHAEEGIPCKHDIAEAVRRHKASQAKES
jgi:hypothetical protein